MPLREKYWQKAKKYIPANKTKLWFNYDSLIQVPNVYPNFRSCHLSRLDKVKKCSLVNLSRMALGLIWHYAEGVKETGFTPRYSTSIIVQNGGGCFPAVTSAIERNDRWFNELNKFKVSKTFWSRFVLPAQDDYFSFTNRKFSWDIFHDDVNGQRGTEVWLSGILRGKNVQNVLCNYTHSCLCTSTFLSPRLSYFS